MNPITRTTDARYDKPRARLRSSVDFLGVVVAIFVEAGQVSFDLLKQYLSLSPVMTVRWAIETGAIHEAEARQGIEEGYPTLAALRLDCRGCSK